METVPHPSRKPGVDREVAPALPVTLPEVAADPGATPQPPARHGVVVADGGHRRPFGLIRNSIVTGLAWAAQGLRYFPAVRRALVARVERRLDTAAAATPIEFRHAAGIEADKRDLRVALLRTVDRAVGEGRLSAAGLRGLLRLLVRDVLIRKGDQSAKARFRARHGGVGAPDFLVVSPGRACNLCCRGCYANAGPSGEKLPWATLDRIVAEAHDLWGARFFVVSGGEPLVYRDQGRSVLDLAARHRDCFFIMYTNGTLIDDRMAQVMARLGNLSPGLSIEGMRERTDARRGAGVFDRVLAAATRLRREGVVFGLSLTATRENADEILSDEVIDLFFGELGALYAWIFQYMPIGRAFTLDLMPTPAQRLQLWRRMWQLIRERGIFLVDFWNSGTASGGCVAGGRPGGYLHVDWNGAVSPCVFIPYSPVNIQAAYRDGKTLEDVWAEPFFAGIRNWQRGYGYREGKEARATAGNWLAPCIIRDHHAEFMRLVREHRPIPSDDHARAALLDPAYHAGIEAFDRELADVTGPIWAARYGSGVPPGGRSGS